MSYRTPLFIDRATVTYDVQREHHSHVLRSAESLQNNEQLTRIYGGDLLNNYQRAYDFRFGPTQSLKMQVQPRTPRNPANSRASRGRRFIRLDWNPRKARRVDAESWHRIMYLMNQLIPDFTQAHFIETAFVTRLDLAFDVHGPHVDGIQIFSLLRRPFSGHYSYGPKGITNSIEIGKPKNDKYLSVYDKREEQKTSQTEAITATLPYSRVIRRPWTRFELQLRDIGSFEQLAYTSNPFEGFTVRTIKQISQVTKSHVEGWFLDSCRLRGIQAALSTIKNQRERTAFANIVRQASPPTWWNPESIWLELPLAVQELFSR